MLNILVVITTLIQIMVGLLVYRKGRNNLTNIMFGVISFTTLAWAIANYIYTLDPAGDSAMTIIRITMAFVVLQNTAFYVFAHNYPEARLKIARKKLTIFLSLSGVLALIALSPLIFQSVTVIDGRSNPNPGPLIPLFLIHAIYTISSGLRSLFRKLHHAVGIQKKQLQFIVFASILIWIVVPFTNFALALVLKTTFFAQVGPIYTLIFGGIIAYAIVAQKLFDVQAAIARSVGYTLTMLTMSAAFVTLGFVLPSYFLGLPTVSDKAQIIYGVIALLLAFSFQTIRGAFDKLSNRLFYQDAYDPQELINQTNRVLATTPNLDLLLDKTAVLLTENLKLDQSAIVIRDSHVGRGSKSAPRIAHSNKRAKVNDVAMRETFDHLSARKVSAVVVTDSIVTSNPELYHSLHERGVSALARIGKSHQADMPGTGYILLGNKRSGNPYNKQDAAVLEIVANELVVAIQNALRYEEIERFNETLQAKVTDATRKLRNANEKLKTLNETKDDFIGMASHQLRTPLTSVKGYLSLVLDGDAGKVNETQQKLLGQAFVSSQRMVYLIADLLNVSRLRTGKFVIERTPTNVADMISDELGQLREMAASRNVELTFEPPANFPALPLDETKTRQVVMNFIDNAIYYTPTGGKIRIEVKDLPKSIELRVIDNGIGVPKGEHHHLFTKFYRAKNAQRARPDGTGLGLFMAKKVIVAQGGALIFNSVEGQGSTFGFIFPKNMKLETEVKSEKIDL